MSNDLTPNKKEILKGHAYWIGHTVELGHRHKVGCSSSPPQTAVIIIL